MNGFIVVTKWANQTSASWSTACSTPRNRGQADVDQAGHIDMFSGNTILGDGAVIMIITPTAFQGARRSGGLP